MTARKTIPNVTGRSKKIPVRFRFSEVEWLEANGGVGPCVHRLIQYAMSASGETGRRIRAYCREYGISVAEFTELTGLYPPTVEDVIDLAPARMHQKTKARIEEILSSPPPKPPETT